MDIFLILLVKLLPFYALIILGFIGGKYLKITKESVASLLLYFISPVVIFNGILTTYLTPGTLSIPLLFFILCSITSVIAYIIAGFIWKDSTKNILSFTAGSANTGFFGLPVAVSVFGTYVIGVAALVIIGTGLFQSTVGFFLAAKGKHSTRESILKVLKLPMLYAFISGVFINLSGIQLPETITDSLEYFNGAFIVLGMMLIGIAVTDVKKLHFDMKYFAFSLVNKYLLWPGITLGIIWLDKMYFHLYDTQLYNLFFFMSVVPVATGIVSYATLLQTQPEKVSLDVMISTIAALVIIPLAAALYF